LARVVPPPHPYLSNTERPEQFALTFSPDDRWLAYAYGRSNGAAPYVMDLGQPEAAPISLNEGGPAWRIRPFAFSAAGDQLWSAYRKPQVIWRLPGLQAVPQPGRAAPGPVVATAFAQDQRVAAYLQDKVRWTTIDLATGQELFGLPPTVGNTDKISRPLFSADGKQLLVGFRDSSRSPRDPAVRVQVWD